MSANQSATSTMLAGARGRGGAASPRTQRLPDLCAEMFAFALNLRGAKDPGTVESLQRTIAQLLDRLGQRAREAGIDSAHLEQARYVICALLDEIVLGSRWELKSQWLSQPLQMVYFQDFTAGEQFYKRLEALRGAKDARLVDLLEVYALSLAVGFRGKHADLAGMQKVTELTDSLVRELRASRGVESRLLSAVHTPTAALPERVSRLPVWVVAACAVAFLLLLLLLLDAILASKAAAFLAGTEGAR